MFYELFGAHIDQSHMSIHSVFKTILCEALNIVRHRFIFDGNHCVSCDNPRNKWKSELPNTYAKEGIGHGTKDASY